jgi:predicted transcriptional regulator
MTSVARTAKQEAAELLSQLPEDVSIEDIQYHLYVLDKIRRGRQAVAEGRIVTQQEACEPTMLNACLAECQMR